MSGTPNPAGVDCRVTGPAAEGRVFPRISEDYDRPELGDVRAFVTFGLTGRNAPPFKPFVMLVSCDAVLLVRRRTRAVAGQGLSIAESH